MGPQRETTDYAAEPVSRGNLRQQVTSRLMTGIFQGRFHSGQRLVVQSLAGAYHASPTPVREALVELASLGLVDLLPNRGAVVQPFGPQEIREISQIRRLLEVEATSCACGRIPVDELSALEREFLQLEVLPHDQAWDHRARAADSKLHGLVADCCGSRRLAAEIGRYLALFRRCATCRISGMPGRIIRARTTYPNTWRSSPPCSNPTPMPRAGPWTGISGRPRSSWRRSYSPERRPSRWAGRPSGPRSLLALPSIDFIPI